MLVLKAEAPELFERIEQSNLTRQYGLMKDCIDIGLSQGGRVFDKYMLWTLNDIAVANTTQRGGRYRQEPVSVGRHLPPRFEAVPDLVDDCINTVHESWYDWTPTELAAYALWRLNWIHPFVDGNGRTARAASYYLLATRSGGEPAGQRIVPERIRDNLTPYYAALQAADRAWELGILDISEMEDYLASLVQAQVEDDGLPYSA